jgi:hypothetical protein
MNEICFGCITLKFKCVIRQVHKEIECPCIDCIVKPMCQIGCMKRESLVSVIYSNNEEAYIEYR